MKALRTVSLLACMGVALASAGCALFQKASADKMPEVSPNVSQLQLGMSMGAVKQAMQPLKATEHATPVLVYEADGLQYAMLFYNGDVTLTAVLVKKIEPMTTSAPAKNAGAGKMWFYLPENKRGQEFKGKMSELENCPSN